MVRTRRTRLKVCQTGAKMIRALAAKLGPQELSREETLAAIDLAQKRGVQGARIHDLIHARSAALGGAELILTRDQGFSSLGEGIKTEWP